MIFLAFSWPALDFGWNLADVLKKSRETTLVNNNLEDRALENLSVKELPALPDAPSLSNEDTEKDAGENEKVVKENGVEDKADVDADDDGEDKEDWVGEIGIWSNDMVLENGIDYSNDMNLVGLSSNL